MKTWPKSEPLTSKRPGSTDVDLAQIDAYLGSQHLPRQTGCYLRDLRADEHFWSPEVFQFYGLPSDEKAPGLIHLKRLLRPTAARTLFTAAEKGIKEGSSFTTEYDIRHSDGSVTRLLSRGQVVPSQVRTGPVVMGTVVDVTRYAEACAALKRVYRAHLFGNSTLAAMPDGPGGTGGPALLSHLSQSNSRLRDGLTPAQLNRAMKVIESKLTDGLSIKDLARAVGLSPAYFARGFRQATGMPPHRFILSLRLQRASAALQAQAEGKIAGVAIEFGFFDQSHFTRNFRRKFGLTPGAFRRGEERLRKKD